MSPNPTLVVFGAGGQLGLALAESVLPSGWHRVDVDRGAADLTDPGAVARVLTGIQLGVVVNAAAYTAVDRAETEVDAAFAVNRDGTANIAKAAAEAGLPLIHVSTDYVYDGMGTHPYVESDATGPMSVYGASKLAGEDILRTQFTRSLILRTSWVFGAHRANFVRTIIRLAGEREELAVVADQIGCPTPTADLAAAIIALAPRLLNAPPESDSFGLFHCCGTGPVSWHGLAAAILEEMTATGRKIPRLRPIPSSEYPLPARRPAYSVMNCDRLAQVHGIHMPSWRPGLRDVVRRVLA